MLRYEVVDVFADSPYAGNPLAVVFGADDLDTPAMQSIAREFNLSETTFPVRTATRADYRLRIFTPVNELPFAGHPSVGTAWLMAQRGLVKPGQVTQECGAGLLPLEVDDDGATLTGGEASVGDPLEPEPLLSAVGLTIADYDPVAAPRVAGTGLPQVHLPVRRAALARAVPDSARILAVDPAGMINLFAWDADSRTSHARMFGAGAGVVEDPATGSAALGFGVWLASSELVPEDGTTTYTIRQGIEMGRPSRLEGSVTTAGGRVVRTTVRGSVVAVARGEIARPPR
ncbi:MAG: PhzF family phenazine biosynthesis protein [Actinomycetes bacterium]